MGPRWSLAAIVLVLLLPLVGAVALPSLPAASSVPRFLVAGGLHVYGVVWLAPQVADPCSGLPFLPPARIVPVSSLFVSLPWLLVQSAPAVIIFAIGNAKGLTKEHMNY